MVYKRERTFDEELLLVKREVDYDELGNQVTIETTTNVLCNVESIGRNEFYEASNQGLKPVVVFVIHAFEYEDQSTVEYKGVRYSVMRTYKTNFEELEITCERVIGHD